MKSYRSSIHPFARLAATLGAVGATTLAASHSAEAFTFSTIGGGGGVIFVDPCTTPSDAQCATSSLYSKTDACSLKMQSACSTKLKSQWKASEPASGAPKKLYAMNYGWCSTPEATCLPTDPWDLVDGRAEPWNGASAAVIAQSSATVQGDMLWYKAAIANPALAAWRPYLRYGAQFTNDNNVASCKEYAYKRNWDYEQFQDDADQCVGDARCVYDAAYTGPHFIAWRTLREKNGIKLLDHQIALVKDIFPKNPFFEVPLAALWNYASTDPVKAAKVTAISDRIKAGAEWYGIGSGVYGKGESFGDEWSFHQSLHDRTTAITDAEFEELARRKQAIEQATFDFTAALIAATLPPDTTATSIAGMVPGFPGGIDPAGWGAPDGVTDPDPLANSEMMRVRLGALVSGGALASADVPTNIATTLAGLTTNAIAGGGPLVGGGGGIGGLGGGGFGLSGAHGAVHTGTGHYARSGALAPASTSTSHTARGGALEHQSATPPGPMNVMDASAVIAARKKITDLMLDEWARIERGAPSCLQLDDVRCDWTPASFAARITNLYKADLERANADCMDIAGVDFSSVPVPAASRTDVPVLKSWIDATRALWRAEFAAAPQYPGAGTGVVGAEKTGGDTLGDKSLFAAGYDYAIGWKIQKAKAVSTTDKRACAFKGDVHANVHADAWALNQNLASILGMSHIVDSESKVAVDPVVTKEASLTTHTRIVGYDVYTPVDEHQPASWTWTLLPTPGVISTSTVSAEFVIVVVPVTFQAHAELRYGAALNVTAGATDACAGRSPTDTSTPQPTFGATVGFLPYANVDAIGSLGVGVPGFSIGVKGELALLHVSVPISGGANVAESTPGSGKLVVRFDTKGDMKLTELSGKISLYAEALFLSYEKELFHWAGNNQTLPLWDAHTDIDLSAYQTAN